MPSKLDLGFGFDKPRAPSRLLWYEQAAGAPLGCLKRYPIPTPEHATHPSFGTRYTEFRRRVQVEGVRKEGK
jgi:hypothetical protein